jgi:hypothetical protein
MKLKTIQPQINRRNVRSNLLFIFFIFFLFINSCKDNELLNELPKATQSGENIFACIVNNEAWIAEDGGWPLVSKISIVYDESGEYPYGKYSMSLIGTKISEWGFKSEKFRIHLGPILKGVPIDFSGLEIFSIEYEKKEQEPNENAIETKYQVDQNSNINIQITKLDTIENIFAGEFEFQLINEVDSSDRLIISDGRFDAVYRTY